MKGDTKMPRINCSVESCYYNDEKICQAEILQISGKEARITEATCCETYRDGTYSKNAIDTPVDRGETKEILCKVDTCAYNRDRRCSLNEIQVSSLTEVNSYTETDCLSFERR